ncbi:enolase-phosphatase E1-like protein [Dinothrombium tinctorium]|uniref:Enolase-phosphatase E1-like protein n=1 Tax=Dinothrombium tinctorium TaxID=1965070 RepID=A0A443R2K2_9ACAR|nr:enolase-phosphatase E1-like protein [Dinothrombium tinctorium]
MKVRRPKALLLDIEGTITAIDFVRKTLFEFVKHNLESYLKFEANADELKADIALLRQDSLALRSLKPEYADIPLIEDQEFANDEEIRAAVVANVLWQMSKDLKTRGLKQFQGHMWRVGYANGVLKAHIFEDVPLMLSKWKDIYDIDYYIYSSGSVEAQKLLLANTINGDLLHLFSGFFDTAVGAKVESESYFNILKALNLNGDQVLFLTDVAKEAEAASNAGMNCLIVIREGNSPLDEEILTRYKTIHSFEELEFV